MFHLSRRIFVGVLLILVLGVRQGNPKAQNQLSDLLSAPSDLAVAVQKFLARDGSNTCDATAVTDATGQFVLALVDYSGRQFCNEVIRIAVGAAWSVVQRLETWGLDSLSGVSRDLDGDGIAELILPKALSSYDGADNCLPTFPVVYQCSAGSCSDESRQYVAYFARHLESLQAESSAQPDRGRQECIDIEIAKAQRLIGMDSRAGFEMAVRWMDGGDARLRRKAIDVFADINDGDSQLRIDTLANDSDQQVATAATIAISRRKR